MLTVGGGVLLAVAFLLISDIFMPDAQIGLRQAFDRLAIAAFGIPVFIYVRRYYAEKLVLLSRRDVPAFLAYSILSFVALLATSFILARIFQADLVFGARNNDFTLVEILSIFTQVTAEEVAFRVFLPILLAAWLLRKAAATNLTIAISVVLFSFWHLPSDFVTFIDHLFFGTLMTLLLIRFKSLVAPIIFHIMNNLYGLFFDYSFTGLGEVPVAAVVFSKYLVWGVVFLLMTGAAKGRSARIGQMQVGEATSQRKNQSERLKSIDALRAVALLIIMIENLLFYMPAEHRVEVVSTASRLARALVALLLEYRGLPLFCILLGFGLSTVMYRYGPKWREHVRIRNFAFLLIGFVHGYWFFSGEILFTYGVSIMIFVLMIRKRGRLVQWQIVVMACLYCGYVLILPITILLVGLPMETVNSYLSSSFSQAQENRALEWLGVVVISPVSAVGILLPVAIGFTTGQVMNTFNGLPSTLPFKRKTAWLLIGSSPVLCLPYALSLYRSWGSDTTGLLDALSMIGAQLGGLSGASGVWLLVVISHQNFDGPGVARRSRNRVCAVLSPLGKVSLSGYILQSLIYLTVLPPFALGLNALPLPLLIVGSFLMWMGLVILAHRGNDRSAPLEHVVRWLVREPMWNQNRLPGDLLRSSL